MSNNHSHDNIYSILGKLDALKPTPEEKHQSLIKEIQESVEAQGSILEGVDAVEARLAKQFAEGEITRTPGKTVHRSTNAYGGTPAEKDPLATLDKAGTNRIEKSIGVKFDKGGQHNTVQTDEVAPPGEKAERMVKHIKQAYAKDGKLTDKEKAIAYATTWGAHKKGQVEEAGEVCAECGMHEGSCQHTKMKEGEFAGRPATYGVYIVGHNNGKPVKTFDTEAEAEAYANKGVRVGNKLLQGSVRTIVGEDETTHTGGEKVSTTKGTIHKSKATVDTEKELSRGDVPDLDKDDDAPASTEKKGRGRPKMATKDRSQARMPWGGKPPKASAHKLPAWPKEKTRVHKMVGESMADSMKRLEQRLTESRLLDDAGETLQHILNRFRAEVRNFEQGGDLDNDLYHALFDYYNDAGEMPYGVAKARDGDPMEWVAQNLESHLRGGGVVGGNQEDDYSLEREGIEGNMPPVDNIPGKEDLLRGKGRSYYEEETECTDTMEEELNELARLAGIQTTDEGNAFTGKLASTPKGGEFELDGKKFKDTSSLGETDLEEDDMEEGNEFSGELAKAKAQHKKEFEVDGKTYPVKESTSFDTPAGADSQFNISTSMSSDGNKNVTVTATGDHAAGLLQMLRIAGLGGGEKAQELQAHSNEPEVVVIGEPSDMPDCELEMDEDGVDFDEPSVEPANAPNEKYGSIKNITTQGDDLNREKTQDPYTANKAANPMAHAQKTLKAVAQLESKLAAEYESIKKISK